MIEQKIYFYRQVKKRSQPLGEFTTKNKIFNNSIFVSSWVGWIRSGMWWSQAHCVWGSGRPAYSVAFVAIGLREFEHSRDAKMAKFEI